MTIVDMNPADVRWIERRLPNVVHEVNYLPCWVAGGFLRSCISGEPVHDVDLWTTGEEAAQKLADAISARTGNEAQIRTPNAITFRTSPPIQIIHRWTFSSVDELIDSFDFTIARAAVWWNTAKKLWEGRCDERFYQDLAAKRLTYCSPQRAEDEAGSLLRLLKFYGRGYKAPLDSIAAVTARAMRQMEGGISGAAEEQLAAHIRKRLLVVDPAADPADEGHML